MEILFFLFLGVGVGIICGLSPFITPSMAMLSLLFILQDGSITALLCFYVALITTIQYVGSVPAVLFGVPGEISNLQTAQIGHALARNGKSKRALLICAQSSLLGGIIGLLLFFLIFFFTKNLYLFYNIYLQIFFILFCFLILIFFVPQKWYINLSLIVIGYLISSLKQGENKLPPFLHSLIEIKQPDVLMGVPLFTVIVGLIVVPNLFKKINYDYNLFKERKTNKVILPYFDKKRESIRGAMIGFAAGLLPGLSYIISSQLAYSFENWYKKFNSKTKSKQDNEGLLAAAESANNAAGISTLIPLLFFGIPITISEGILSDILWSSGQSLSYTIISQIFFWLLLSFIISNMLGFIFSFSFSGIATKFLIIHANKIKILTIALMSVGIVYMGVKNLQFEWYVLCALIFSLAGTIFRRANFIPLVLTMVLQPRFESLAKQIYFISF